MIAINLGLAMQSFFAPTLRARSLAGAIVSVTVIGLLALAYHASTDRLSRAVSTQTLHGRLLADQGAADMAHDAIRADVLLILALGQQNAPTQEALASLQGDIDILTRSLAAVQRRATDPRVLADLGPAMSDTSHYVEAAHAAVRDPHAGLGTVAVRSFLESFHVLEGTLGALGKTIGSVIADADDHARAQLHLVNVGYAVVLAIGIAGVLASLAASFSVSRRLGEMMHSVEGIADDESDLSRRVDVRDARDEVSAAARALNRYLDSITRIVMALRESSTRLHAAIGDMNHLASETRESVVQAGTRVAQAAQDVDDVARSVTRVAELAQQTAVSTQDANEQSGAGSAVVVQTVAAIGELGGNVEQTAADMQVLFEQSQQMGGVLQVIRELAEQTNLLALNAAIEAARAGEQGRGFAVVADEVRKLAGRTHDATVEIDRMIKRLHDQVQDALDGMKAGLAQARTCRGRADEAGDTFTRIATAVDHVAEMNHEVARAASEQRSSAEHLSQNMTEVNATAQTAVQLSEQIMHAAAQANQVAEALETTILRFRTAGGEETARVTIY